MIIAQRTLRLNGKGQRTEIPIRIHAPEERETYWRCRFEIEWPEEPVTRWGDGSDAVQALLIAMQMIGAEIYASDHHRAGQLFWLAPARGYGFPVPKNIQDMLVGDDKKFL